MKNTKSITAFVHNDYSATANFWSCARECGENPKRVRVRVPESLATATTAGCREVDTGIVLVGVHRGRAWGVAKFYNRWVTDNGACRGDEYVAYDLNDAKDAETFAKIEEAE